MHKVAIIEAKQSRNNYRQLFNEEFEFDQLQLCSNKDIPKVLAKDVDLKVNLEDYDWVILIGSEPLKYFTKLTSIMEYSGKLVDKKFLPSMNPAMLAFKPEAKKDWVAARDNIIGYVTGTLQATEVNGEDFVGIEEEHDAESYIKAALESDKPYFAIDTETSALYPRNGYVLGISLSYTVGKGAYISSDALSPKAEELLQQLLIEKLPVFHNAKFDIAMLEYHFKFKIPKFEDTMLLHYTLDETQGSHGLKELSLKYTKWGDYERPMYDWIESYKKAHGVTKDEFKWEWIPFEVMKTYAALDANCTLALYELFKPKVDKNSKLKYVYDNILIPGTRLVIDMQDNGVPFSRERLQLCDQLLTSTIEQLNSKLRSFPEVQRLEQVLEKPLNPNSVVQLRKLFFDDLGLPVTKRTEKGEPSTDKTVLEFLSDKHEVPNVILGIRQSIKIKSTYVDKILIGLDKDDRLRTGFHLHVTSSGRLSSSGRLNMQQLPRDNPLVKGSIKAPLGRKIVAMDLGTAEMYIAAVLSKDRTLQKAFIDRKDFHSSIAREVFRLACEVEEVKDLYPFERQAAKAISFGILYGAGSSKIAEEISKNGEYISAREASIIINNYFKRFPQLKHWIDSNKEFITNSGFIYSFFGRKRRLPEVFVEDKGAQGHAIRSGLNFLVQSVASDINLLGAIEANSAIKKTGMDANIFALVHDSILADVAEDCVDSYVTLIRDCIQRDRGLSIVGCPISCDFDVADDYALGKFEKYVSEHYLQKSA